jgi:hypothetical protein
VDVVMLCYDVQCLVGGLRNVVHSLVGLRAAFASLKEGHLESGAGVLASTVREHPCPPLSNGTCLADECG